MRAFPTEGEVEKAADLLVHRYHVSAQLVGQLFGADQRDQANSILQALGAQRLRAIDVAKLLIRRAGPALFAGSEPAVRKLRLHLLNQLPDAVVEHLFQRHGPRDTRITRPSRMRTRLAQHKWKSGKHWPRAFVEALGFPAIFAGVAAGEDLPTIVEVAPLTPPPKLADFQQTLKDRMREVLDRDGVRTRCVVTLPTGGGKTRVAVEAFIDWMQTRIAEGQFLVWVAQSEELCEQAIACIEQMWSSREYVAQLRIYRYFGSRELEPQDLAGGAVVASIQQLYNRTKGSDPAIEHILRNTGAMIIDEAHRAVTQMYNVVLDAAIAHRGPDLFPICGLTATPGRAGLNSQSETLRLVDRFEAYLIKPNLGPEYDDDPLRYFRDHGYLARARHTVYESGREYTLTDSEAAAFDAADPAADLPVGFLRRLAEDRERNLFILRKLCDLPRATPTLVYACTVEHAYFLAALLNASGRAAGAVSSETPATVRRGMIRAFKEGELEFLCNFGVLTTGFDAPKTECIALVRPTSSPVLYEQIIGRGLRGEAFGGTAECTIMDFADNIRRLGRPLAYERFADFWSQEPAAEAPSRELVPAGP